MRWDILNRIAELIGAERYLEIGVSDGVCLSRVNVGEKWGVDPAPRPEGVVHATAFAAVTSEVFFGPAYEKERGLFDLIFLDGNHIAEDVYNEVLLALRCLTPNGVIVLHDCNPSTEEMQRVPFQIGDWTGDVWKAVARIRTDRNIGELRVVDADFGVGILVPNRNPTSAPDTWASLVARTPPLAWRDLEARRLELLGLLPADGWERAFTAMRTVALRNPGEMFDPFARDPDAGQVLAGDVIVVQAPSAPRRPRVFDCFPLFNELDLLECRLEELYDVVDCFVIAEAGETHLGTRKASFFKTYEERFAKYRDKIQYVWRETLPDVEPRLREYSHRNSLWTGVLTRRAEAGDIVIHSDLDELPTAESIDRARSVLRNDGVPAIAFLQRPHYFAVDWQHPRPEPLKPIAILYEHLQVSMTELRQKSPRADALTNAGFHFSWLGDVSTHLQKVGAIYEGPEIWNRVVPDLLSRRNVREGVHVDGVKMAPVELDETFPRYIRERRCPANWFRPRDS